jgi:hypothetical protein
MAVLSALYMKSKSSKKATNRDLPEGAQPAYCCEVVPSIWHWVVGNASDPFNIDEGEMVNVLQMIWACIYSNSIAFNPILLVSLVSKVFTPI